MLISVLILVVSSTGTHQRWQTERGAVHTWYPGPTVPTKVVLYVHGYYETADSAFEGHHLAEQFASSGVDALFVVPEAPAGKGQPVFWPSLEQLLEEVSFHHATSPPETVLVLGHSGGNRTIKAWLASPMVKQVVLLDGFYGDPTPFEAWLARRSDATLVLISQSTAGKATAWVNRLSPLLASRVSQRPARCSHMQIVTAGSWIPELVRESL